jgi:hypothetical protein
MFLTGDWLQDRLIALDEQVQEATQGAVRREEHIALPYFGQIIVRFQTNEAAALEEVDAWERKLQRLVGDDFLVDFMGSVYRRLGVDYRRLDEIVERLGQRFKDEPMCEGPFAEQIEADAQALLLLCGMPETAPVWEIQWEEGEYALLLLGQENRPLRTVEGEPPIHVMEVNGVLCEGLMRAAFAAKRMGVSLGRLMLEAMEG